MGVGLALAVKMKGKANRTWVLCVDSFLLEVGVEHYIRRDVETGKMV